MDTGRTCHRSKLAVPLTSRKASLFSKFVAQNQDPCTITEKVTARRGTKLSPKQKDRRPLASLSAQPGEEEQPYHPVPAHFLQHAWARAVLNDATFIMFSCGSYARIGLRDRASRTLYLSDLIKTATCTRPSYGKLNMGLHLAIFKDALERQEQRFNAWKASNPVTVDAGTSAGRKRKRENEEDSTYRPSKSESGSVDSAMTGSKRRKIEAEPNTETNRLSGLKTAISAELGRRNFALINLNYGVLNSPAPSTFIRRGTSCVPGMYQEHFKAPDRTEKFTPHQAFSLTLSEPFDKGATSLVQRATVEVQTESGEVLKHSLIVKLVFPDKENRPEEYIPRRVKTDEGRLLQEFRVYEYLARHDATERLVPVHGLFEDIDTGVLALIMEDAGISVFDSESHRTGNSITFSEKEGKMLIEAVEDIHAAGVFHADIRLRNIVVDLKGGAFLIDFDRAYILDDRFPFDGGPRERNIIEEMECIEDIVNGLETRDYFDYYV